MAEKILSIEKVAKWLGVNPRTIYRLVQKGQIPGFKLGGQWRFNDEVLKEWMADQMTVERLKAEERQAGENQVENNGKQG